MAQLRVIFTLDSPRHLYLCLCFCPVYNKPSPALLNLVVLILALLLSKTFTTCVMCSMNMPIPPLDHAPQPHPLIVLSLGHSLWVQQIELFVVQCGSRGLYPLSYLIDSYLFL